MTLPARSSGSLAISHAPGESIAIVRWVTGPVGTPVGPMPLIPIPRMFSGVIAVVRSVAPSCARTLGAATWTTMKSASVSAIAGTVRRTTVPAATPSAKANAV